MPDYEEWTVNKASVNFGIDRRELSRIIEEVDVLPLNPESTIKKYKVKDLFEALKYGSQKLELTQEKAKQAMESARRMKRENDIAERLVAPIEELEEAISSVSSQAASILDSLVPNIKRRVPELSARDIMFIEKEIANCRNSIASMKI